jgi:ferredoxin
MARRRLAVDWPACKAHGLCAELLPEIVELDEWGYPVIEPGPVPPSLKRYAQRAVSSCPTLALRLVPDVETAEPATHVAVNPVDPVDPVATPGQVASWNADAAGDPVTPSVSPRRRARRSS